MSEEKGKLIISINGENEGESLKEKLSPSNFDISELIEVLKHLENLVKPVHDDKSPISYNIKTGSVLNELEISKDTIKRLNQIFYDVNYKRNLEGIDTKQAEAIEYFQKMSREKTRNIKITNTIDPRVELNITPYTNYKVVEDLEVDIDLTLYGKITYIGGKKDPALHLDTQEHGVVTVRIKEYILKRIKENIIYKEIGLNVSAKQSIYTYKLRDLSFLSFVEYSREYDCEYMDSLIENGREVWKDITDTDNWLKAIRG